MDSSTEFDRQRDRLIELGYPALAGLSTDEFAAALEPLRAAVPEGSGAPSTSSIPWILVVTMVDAELLVPLLHLSGSTEPGVVDRNHGEAGLAPYAPLPTLDIPKGPAYILYGIERGEEFCNVRPEEALPVITGRGRTPLTILEGIALVTHFSEVLEANAASRLDE